MKRNINDYLIYLFVFSVFQCVSCSPADLPAGDSYTIGITETKAQVQDEKSEYDITIDDIDAYAKYRSLRDKSDAKLISCEPMFRNGQLCAYALNFDDGWEIVSADKRANPVLAYCCGEKYVPEERCSGEDAWIDAILEEVSQLKQIPGIESSVFSDSEIAHMSANALFWDAVTISERMRDRLDGLLSPPMPHIGHYELDSVECDTIEFNTVNHLVQVHWNQEFPYNCYCPRTSYTYPISFAPAGCVAIAGAQVLYYLHYFINYPECCPDSASCSGNVNSFEMQQYGSSSTIWDQMAGNSFKAAILIANVGKLTGIIYGNDRSYGTIANLVEHAFDSYGIDCTYYNFSLDSLTYCLNQGFPAIMGSESMDSDSGHSFLIDGYKSYKIEYKYTYIWCSEDPSPDYQTIIDPIFVNFVYSAPFVNDLCMNWGYGAAFDEGWYGISGPWSVGIHNYSPFNFFISGFSPRN